MARLLAAFAGCCAAHDCLAIDRVVLEIGQLSTAGVQATGATITLDVTPEADHGSSTLRTEVAELRLPARRPFGNTFTDIDISCTSVLMRQPQFGCTDGQVAVRTDLLGPVSMSAAAVYDSSTRLISFHGSGLQLAGATTRLNGTFQSGAWSLDADADRVDLSAAQKLARSWFQLPAGDSLTGHVLLQLRSTGRLDSGNPPGKVDAHWTLATRDLNYSNQPGTAVGQNIAAVINGAVAADRGQWQSDLQLRSSNGQFLAGVALFDFGKNPLSLQAHVQPAGKTLGISELRLEQTDLLEAQGDGQISFQGPVSIERAHLDVYRLEVGAAYRTFLQLALASTDFGALNVGGRAGGSLDVARNQLSAVDVFLQNVSMADATTRLSLANANGEIHWIADPKGTVQGSQLSWSSSSAYGLLGGPVQMDFTTHGADFQLAGNNTHFPVFDGALVIHTLALRRLGAPDTELDFDAHIEPVSMPLLSKAFGWPPLSGQLAGTIPGVTYRDHVLAVQGDLVAHVFDGIIVGSHLKLTDPWGRWPQLAANVTARNLDLDLLTHTFSIGSISGRLDADLNGLELFNWAPVAFDARLQTTPGDSSRHLISQRAVTSISNVGGGGGGVTAALQSGVLQFFKTFHYDRLGIRCQLRDEICVMSGIEPARDGYYLVKGRGLPRIDIIGNAGRVDWTQLVGQISASMHSQNILVR
jgi:hypothetical protein